MQRLICKFCGQPFRGTYEDLCKACFYAALPQETPPQDMDEYLRRNLLVAKAYGAAAAARTILNRIATRKRVPKWLVKQANDIYSRANALPHDLAIYRDELIK